MEEKYIKFYQSFHKGFQGKKSYSLFHSSQSLWSDFRIVNPIPYCSAMLSGAVEAENDAN